MPALPVVAIGNLFYSLSFLPPSAMSIEERQGRQWEKENRGRREERYCLIGYPLAIEETLERGGGGIRLPHHTPRPTTQREKGPHPLNSLYPEKVSLPAFKFSSYSDPPHPREDTPRARQKYSTKCLPTQEKKYPICPLLPPLGWQKAFLPRRQKRGGQLWRSPSSSASCALLNGVVSPEEKEGIESPLLRFEGESPPPFPVRPEIFRDLGKSSEREAPSPPSLAPFSFRAI